MNFTRDDRAVTEILGAILVFGILVLLLVLTQVTLVPALNQQVEVEHSERSVDDLRDVQTGVSRVAAGGAPEETSVEAGLLYPRRPLLLNPGDDVQGVVETTEPESVTLSNARALTAETDEYWDGTRTGEYTTRALRAEAQYREFATGQPFVLEGTGALFADGERAILRGEQGALVDDRRINLVLLDGAYREFSQGSVTVPLEPVSAPATPISITDSGAPITITIPTGLDQDHWDDQLGEEPNVRSIDVTDGLLTVELRPGVTYELRMAKVGVGADTVEERPAYLTREAGTVAVPAGGGEVSVLARDAYNNPVSGAVVNFSVTGGTATLSSDQATTDEDGRATVAVSGPDGTPTLRAAADFDGDGTVQNYEAVVVGVTVGTGGGGGGGGSNDVNPNREEGNLVFERALTVEQGNAPGNANNNWVDVTFRNTGQNVSNVTDLRVNFYIANGPGRSTGATPTHATIEDPAPVGRPTLQIGGRFVSVTDTGSLLVAPGATETVRFSFYEDAATTQEVQAFSGDFFIVTMQFADGTTEVYFVSPLAQGNNNGGGNN
jgi:hypothetical protein